MLMQSYSRHAFDESSEHKDIGSQRPWTPPVHFIIHRMMAITHRPPEGTRLTSSSNSPAAEKSVSKLPWKAFVILRNQLLDKLDGNASTGRCLRREGGWSDSPSVHARMAVGNHLFVCESVSPHGWEIRSG